MVGVTLLMKTLMDSQHLKSLPNVDILVLQDASQSGRDRLKSLYLEKYCVEELYLSVLLVLSGIICIYGCLVL